VGSLLLLQRMQVGLYLSSDRGLLRPVSIEGASALATQLGEQVVYLLTQFPSLAQILTQLRVVCTGSGKVNAGGGQHVHESPPLAGHGVLEGCLLVAFYEATVHQTSMKVSVFFRQLALGALAPDLPAHRLCGLMRHLKSCAGVCEAPSPYRRSPRR
jgi:hypothetical protein